MEKKPDRKLNRKKDFDYSKAGYYFITICVKNRIECFGVIKDGEMNLNEWGVIANDYFMQIPEYHNNIEITEFVIMPNHIHAVMFINDSIKSTNPINPITIATPVGTGQCPVRRFVRNGGYGLVRNGITNDTTNNIANDISRTGFGGISLTGQCPVPTRMKHGDIRVKNDMMVNYGLLSKIINSYKNVVTKKIRGQFVNVHFEWQRSFHDRIVRGDEALQKICNYILNNPANWERDRNNQENLYM